MLVASGKNYPDALAANNLVKKENAILVLSDGESIPEMGLKPIAIGGEKALKLKGKNIEKIGGYDRYETAKLIAQRAYKNTDKVILASGENYPDALTGTALIQKEDAPLVLTEKNIIPETLKTYLNKVKDFKILGGI